MGNLVEWRNSLLKKIRLFTHIDVIRFVRERQIQLSDEDIEDMVCHMNDCLTNDVDQYQAWIDDARIAQICDIIVQCVGGVGVGEQWTNEMRTEAQQTAYAELEHWIDNEQTPWCDELKYKIGQIINQSIERYVEERCITFTPELKECFTRYLMRFAGVPGERVGVVDGQDLAPLWDSAENFNREDKETLIGKLVRSLKKHYDAAIENGEIPADTLVFLQERWEGNIDINTLSFHQVAECVYNGKGFKGGGHLSGNPWYGLALIQAGRGNNHPWSAFDAQYRGLLYCIIIQNRWGVLQNLDVENFYCEIKEKTFYGAIAKTYWGGLGLAQILTDYCQKELLAQVDNQPIIIFNDMQPAQNDEQGDENDANQGDFGGAYQYNGNDAEQNDEYRAVQELLEKLKFNIDETLCSLQPFIHYRREYTANRRRQAYALRFGVASAKEVDILKDATYGDINQADLTRLTRKTRWAVYRVRGKLNVTEPVLNLLCQGVQKEVFNAFWQTYRAAGMTALLKLEMAFNNKSEIRNFWETLNSLDKVVKSKKNVADNVEDITQTINDARNSLEKIRGERDVQDWLRNYVDSVLERINSPADAEQKLEGIETVVREIRENWENICEPYFIQENTILSCDWRNRFVKLWLESSVRNDDTAGHIGEAIAVLLACIDRIDRETGDYNAFFEHNN
ncbi:MAG: hypothetical protein J6K25_14475 [Thermoguttaceae bacterium]|nr:hypothetical protein [Thermoguttaceae bacterium]